MQKSILSIIGLSSFITALFLSFFLSGDFIETFLIFLTVCAFIISFFLLRYSKSFVLLSILVAIVFFIIGLSRAAIMLKEKAPNHVIHFLDSDVSLEGKVDAEVDIRSQHTKYTLEVMRINNKAAQGKILLNASRYPEYKYGDILHLTGHLESPGETESFSYKNYLSRYEIYGTMYKSEIQHKGNAPESLFLAWIFEKKKTFLQAIEKQYKEPEASFLAGLLIGARKGMDEDITDDFQKTGLSHIVAVSGANITIILAIILSILSFIPRILSLIFALISIILFTIFVGMSSAVVRAAIMGIIGLIAFHSGRTKHALISLLLCIALMSAWQPKILLYDIGFQLSVLAIIGILWIIPMFPKILHKLPEKFAIKEAITLTLAAQITTIPLSIMHFQTLSLIAPIANLFVVPLIPFSMLFGFLSLIPIPFFSDLLSIITTLILKLALFFTHFFASFPYSNLENISFPPWFYFLYFGILGGTFFLYYTKKN